MRLLMLSAINVRDDTNKLIYFDDVETSLQMQSKIIPFEAEELAVVDYDPYFFRQPAWFGPVLLALGCVECSIDHEDIRDAADRLASRQLLISTAFVAPSSGLRRALDTTLEDLRKGRDLVADAACCILGSISTALCHGRKSCLRLADRRGR